MRIEKNSSKLDQRSVALHERAASFISYLNHNKISDGCAVVIYREPEKNFSF